MEKQKTNPDYAYDTPVSTLSDLTDTSATSELSDSIGDLASKGSSLL